MIEFNATSAAVPVAVDRNDIQKENILCVLVEARDLELQRWKHSPTEGIKTHHKLIHLETSHGERSLSVLKSFLGSRTHKFTMLRH